MNIWPEALILGGAAILAFLLGAVASALTGNPLLDRIKTLLSVVIGVAVAVLFYVAGLVDTDDLTKLQAVARAVIAGITMAMAASAAGNTPAAIRTMRRG